MNRWVTFLVLALSLGASSARAEVDAPMIEIGGGAAVSTPEGEMSFLLRASFDNLTAYDPQAPVHYVLARMKANLLFHEASNGQKLSYSDIEFVPITVRPNSGISGMQFRILPGRAGTNIRLDERVTLRVDIVGIGLDYLGPSHIHENILLYAKVAADALGYKVASYVSDTRNYHHFNIGAVSAEVGLVLATDNDFKVRIALGGSADLNIATNDPNAKTDFDLQSDMIAYAEISADVKRWFRIFLRNSIQGVAHPALEVRFENRAMIGVTFIF